MKISGTITTNLGSIKVARLAEWVTWQRARSLSTRTIEERAWAVKRFALFLCADPEFASPEHIAAWLADGGDWSDRTRVSYHTALNAWYRWLNEQDHRSVNPMAKVGTPRQPRAEPRPIHDEAMKRLLLSPMHNRTRAMVLLAAMEGLRVHEIAKVKSDHFDLAARMMTVVGKGGVTATLPVHRLVLEQAQRMPPRGFWFPGPDRGHQYRESVSGTIKEAMTRAGVTGSAHQLRHWFGTALVRSGVDLRTVQTLMRHANLSSTAIYTQVADEQRVRGIEGLDPFSIADLQPAGAPD